MSEERERRFLTGCMPAFTAFLAEEFAPALYFTEFGEEVVSEENMFPPVMDVSPIEREFQPKS